MAEHAAPGPGPLARKLTLRRCVLIAFITAVVIAGVLIAVLVPGGAAKPDAAAIPRYDGLTVLPPKQAPALALDNYLGSPVNLASYRGKAVLVTFIYTHCPDTCPLMVSKLHTAQAQMSAAERSRLAIIAVSVDPRGDTPASVAHFLADHEMTGRMQYLIGSAAALLRTWSAWGIASTKVPNTPDEVEHTALIFGITGQGRIAVVYPSNVGVRQIIHDAGLLASA